MKQLFAALVIVGAIAAAGCTTIRTIYVPAGKSVRLGKTIKNCPVWVVDAKGDIVKSKMDVPEGWYAVYLAPTNSTK